MATRIQLRSRVPIAKVKARFGTHATHDDYDVLLHGDCKVFAPDGSMFCALVRGGMDAELSEAAYPALHKLRSQVTDNRPGYSGGDTNDVGGNQRSSVKVRSAVIGYFDRYPRIPFCRQTAFTAKDTARWATVVPLAQQVSALLKKTVPMRHKVQQEYVSGIHPDFVIDDTVFTTITVNNCVTSAYHQDAGDYKPGFGVLTCLRRGNYSGFQLVFPEYRVAVDMQDRDVLFFDPHQWHGNVVGVGEGPEGKPAEGGWERISLVLYVRAKMAACGSSVEEAERAKQARGAL